jgi:hypothetical protein
MNDLSEDFLSKVDKSKTKDIERNTGYMSQKQVDKVYDNLQTKQFPGKDPDDIKVATFIACQLGVTNKNAASRVTGTYNNVTVSGMALGTACREAGGTIRQFARAEANKIAAVCLKLELEGDLHRQMQRQIPDATLEELVYCANFQTFNPNTPSRTAEWLKENFQERFSS